MKAITHRHRSLALLAAAVLALGSAGVARAAGDEPSKPAEEPAKKAEPSKDAQKPTAKSSLSHKYQFGFGFRAGSGYRVVAPYDEQDCGQKDSDGNNKSVCGSLYPFWIELSPSFGVSDSLEVLVDIRLPLGSPDFTDSNGFLIAPGIKYYTDPEGLLKFFLTAQVVFENQTQRTNSNIKSFDVGIRSALGIQFDLLRYVGLYAQAGLIFGFSRWLSFLVDFGGGLQVRY
ncbi:MAG: hypothetical protein KC503_30705 [Myxococcales bacterium]|nr:hypothetical protein [Myxococcales bacterium]